MMERLKGIGERVKVGQPVKDDGRAAREQFSTELLAFAASYRHELVNDVIRVYWQALKGIPVEIRTLGLTRCLQQHKFFPTVAEILNACADVVEARRKALSAEADRIKAECPLRTGGLCNGVMRDTHNGVVRCDCHKQGLALLEHADQPISRPALPPAQNPEVA